MKTLKLAIATSLLSVSMSVHAGFLDGIKKIGGGVAEAVGGAFDATVNITTSAVQSVSSHTTLTVEKKEGRADAEQVSEADKPASSATPASVPEQPGSITIGRRKDVESRALVSNRDPKPSGMGKEMARSQALEYLTGETFVKQLDELLKADSDGSRYKNSRVNAFKILQANDGIKTMWQKLSMELSADEAATLPDYLRQAYVPGDVQNLEQWKMSIQRRMTEEKQYLAKAETERMAKEKEMREAQELVAKRLAEREAKEKAEREAREKAEAEARELTAKQQAEREAREKAAREVRAKTDAEVRELATIRASEDKKDVAVPATAATTQESSGAAPENCEDSSSAISDSEVSLVDWKTLFITLGIWLLIMCIGCAVAFFSKKPSADEIPQRLHKCYFISKLDYVPAMLTVPTLLVLLIGFARSDIGEIWTKILLAICGCGLLAMNWWALLRANATWGQALSLLPMRIVVGTLGLVLPVVSAIMSLAAISLAAAASKAMGEVAANVKKNNGYTRDDINKWNKAKGDMAGGAAAGVLGAAGGWASKKMWGSITSRTRSLVGWEAED